GAGGRLPLRALSGRPAFGGGRGRGLSVSLDGLTLAMVHEMSRRTGTDLTPRHYDLLEFTHRYHQRHRVGPLLPNLRRYTDTTQAELDELFPFGLHSLYTWVGIPIQSPHQSCKPLAHVQVDDPREVYLDHSATTDLRPEVADCMRGLLEGERGFGNPGSSTHLGRMAFEAVDTARARVARVLGVERDELVFTGSGSEANNLAIKGLLLPRLAAGAHAITTAIEHSSVLEPLRWLASLGLALTELPCDAEGLVSAEDVRAALRPDTALVSVMAANNEIGTVNPLTEIGAICREAGVPFMVDAVQAFGKLPLAPREQGISLLSLSGHKVHGPKGVGVLFVDRSLELVPLLHGGGQEQGRRAGTENVASIAGLGLAAELASAEREREMPRLAALRDALLAALRRIDPGLVINGSLEKRLPHNLSVGFEGVDSGSLLLSLNAIGVYASAGSACHAGTAEDSHVIRALGLDTGRYGVLRFTVGRRNTEADIEYVGDHLGTILRELRSAPPANA
ncbi:MAG: cysteine desulfurase family protein, partial [Myxococcota bacterium]